MTSTSAQDTHHLEKPAAGAASDAPPGVQEDAHPVLVCLFGRFRLLKQHQPVALRSGGKTEALLSSIALRHQRGLPRETLVEMLWPDGDPSLARQSLNSLIYSLHKLLGDAIGGAPPILQRDGCYRLNAEAGVGTDVARFAVLADRGDEQTGTGNAEMAMHAYRSAIAVYAGDLVGENIEALIERERLRVRYLNLLTGLADHHFQQEEYVAALAYASRLLMHEPCREDAHRQIMRCYVRRGERAQAFRQFRLCRQILRSEFDTEPEPATVRLMEQVRLDPGGV